MTYKYEIQIILVLYNVNQYFPFDALQTSGVHGINLESPWLIFKKGGSQFLANQELLM